LGKKGQSKKGKAISGKQKMELGRKEQKGKGETMAPTKHNQSKKVVRLKKGKTSPMFGVANKEKRVRVG